MRKHVAPASFLDFCDFGTTFAMSAKQFSVFILLYFIMFGSQFAYQ